MWRLYFEERGLDTNLLTEHPYTLCAVEEFEQAIQIMAAVGINEFMSGKITGEQAHWELATFINRFFEAEAVAHTRVGAAETAMIGSGCVIGLDPLIQGRRRKLQAHRWISCHQKPTCDTN
jgi:hypothetical protein